jgi:hypothetical protein
LETILPAVRAPLGSVSDRTPEKLIEVASQGIGWILPNDDNATGPDAFASCLNLFDPKVFLLALLL